MGELCPKEEAVSRPTTLRLSHHALDRSCERAVPTSVLDALQRHAHEFLGRHQHHRRLKLRIVRQGDTFWVAPHDGRDIITIYAKHRRELTRWANNYLVNPDQNRHRLALIPNHRTPEEAITDELARLWALEA